MASFNPPSINFNNIHFNESHFKDNQLKDLTLQRVLSVFSNINQFGMIDSNIKVFVNSSNDIQPLNELY